MPSLVVAAAKFVCFQIHLATTAVYFRGIVKYVGESR
jgi:hypothetical protein